MVRMTSVTQRVAPRAKLPIGAVTNHRHRQRTSLQILGILMKIPCSAFENSLLY